MMDSPNKDLLAKDQAPLGLKWRDQILLYLVLILWMVLFLVGILVNSGMFRDYISNPGDLGLVGFGRNLLIVIFTYILIMYRC